MENLVSKLERSAGIDIYKILCMFFVIWFHFSDHGSVQITANDEVTFNCMSSYSSAGNSRRVNSLQN